MTSFLNEHTNGSGRHRNLGCLGYAMVPVAVLILIVVAGLLAFAEWQAERNERKGVIQMAKKGCGTKRK